MNLATTTARIALTLTTAAALGAALHFTGTDLAGKATGDPGDNPDATLDLLTAAGGASIAWRGDRELACQNLSDFGVTAPLTHLTLQGPGVGTAVLRLYMGPDCAGDGRDFDATGDETTDVDLTLTETPDVFGNIRYEAAEPLPALSFRIAVAEPQPLPADGTCFAPGETIADNGVRVLALSAERRLGFFRRDAAGGLVPVGYGYENIAEACMAWSGLMGYTDYGVADGGWSVTYGNRLELTADCDLTQIHPTGSGLSVYSAGHCFDGIPVEVPPVEPSYELVFGDIDDDGDPEMMLDIRKPDGSGFIVTDPIGIAAALHATGETIGPRFYMALSATQRDVTREATLLVTTAGGAAGINALLAAVGDDGAGAIGTFQAFPYTFTFEVDEADAEFGLQVGQVGAKLWVNRRRYHLKTDENGISARVEVSELESELTAADGYVTLNMKSKTGVAEFTVVEDGFAIGGSADIVAVSFTGGRQDRSHICIGASHGEGAFVAASWGRKGQYGFSLQVPRVPVSLAIYVHEDDARFVTGRMTGLARRLAGDIAAWSRGAGQDLALWGRDAGHDTGDFARHALTVVRDALVDAGTDTRIALESAALDTGMLFVRQGGSLVVAVRSAGGTTAAFVEGSAEEVRAVFVNTTDRIGDAIVGAAGNVAAFGATIGSTLETAVDDTVNALNDAGNAVAGGVNTAVNAVVDFFAGLF